MRVLRNIPLKIDALILECVFNSNLENPDIDYYQMYLYLNWQNIFSKKLGNNSGFHFSQFITLVFFQVGV